jgi:hypothetical protein
MHAEEGGEEGRSAAVTVGVTYPSPSPGLSSDLLPWSNECARLAQVLVVPVQAEMSSGGGGLRLEEPGNSFVLIAADTFLRYSLCSNK